MNITSQHYVHLETGMRVTILGEEQDMVVVKDDNGAVSTVERGAFFHTGKWKPEDQN